MQYRVIAVLAVVAALLILASAPRQSMPGANVVLALDMSQSMGEPGTDGTTPKIEAVRDAATAMLRFFSQSTPIPRVAVLTFADEPAVLYPLTNNMDAVAAALVDLPAQVGGGTNIGAALATALRQLEGASEGVIVLVSDGVPTQGLTAAQIITGPAQQVKEGGHCFYTLLAHNSDMVDDESAFLQQLRAVAPCPYAGQILSVDDMPRLLWAVSAAANTSPGSEVTTASGSLESGQAHSIEVRVPPDQAEIRVSAVSTGEAVALMLADPNGARPPGETRTEAPGLSATSAANPAAGRWSLTLRNPSRAPVTYYAIISTLPAPLSGSDVDTIISLAVAIAAILGIGLTVLAVERLRPRPSAPGAYLVNIDTGARCPLLRQEHMPVQIGRAPECTIVLTAPDVAACHALVRYGRGRYYLQHQAGDAPTQLNGSPVSAAPLVHGDLITIGGASLRFEQGEREAGAAK